MKSICYDCKHPIIIRDAGGALCAGVGAWTPSSKEEVMKADRIIALASREDSQPQVLCLNCLSKLISSLKTTLAKTQTNQQMLENQMDLIKHQMEGDNTQEPSEAELAAVQQQCAALKLKAKQQNKQFEERSSELFSLIEQERKFWEEEANPFEERLIEFEESSAEVIQRTKVADEELNMLSKVNALNDLFYISSENQFGTISGLRLGRLDNELVPWEEINAAWGQCVLLLSTLSKLRGFRSAQCHLYPEGSFSKIAPVHNEANRYELYYHETNNPTMLNRLNAGQSLFLEGLYEFSLFMEGEDSSTKLPYRISDYQVGDCRIILEPSNKEDWTRALKYMLQNLKYLIVICTREL